MHQTPLIVYLIFGPPGAHYIKFLVLSYLIVFAYPPLQNCMMHFKCAGEVFGIPVKDTKGRFKKKKLMEKQKKQHGLKML